MIRELPVHTQKHREFVDITSRIQVLLDGANVSEGLCTVFSPHTTASVTINENADPDVLADLLRAYTDLLGDERRFAHAEGNSGGHALNSLTGPSVVIPVASGRLLLGRWQAIYLCEWDGPRPRTLTVQVLDGA